MKEAQEEEIISTSSSGLQQYYPYPCHVNAASFMSIKLSGESNYLKWRIQMVCLLDSHDVLGFIDGRVHEPKQNKIKEKDMAAAAAFEAKYREWKRSDTLVKGWIFGSISEDAMTLFFERCRTAQGVWDFLSRIYSNSSDSDDDLDSHMDVHKYIPLCRAIEMGDWDKANEFFNTDPQTLTLQIDREGNTALHIAISNHENVSFLVRLIELTPAEQLPLVVSKKYTALQYAVLRGNKKAVEMLVSKCPELLFHATSSLELPLLLAAGKSDRFNFDYLLPRCKHHIDKVTQNNSLYNPFEGESGYWLVYIKINRGYYDVAYDLLKDYPKLATIDDHDSRGYALHCLTKKPEAYPSGQQYNFYQRFVYSHLRVENYGLLGDTSKSPDIENQETTNVTRKSCVNQVMEFVFVSFWKVLRRVLLIEQLHKDKLKHHKALSVLKFICDEVAKQENSGYKDYKSAIIRAVENDIPEVIWHIVRVFPRSIRTKKDKKYSLYQLSVMNRCEKAFNLLVYEFPHHDVLLYGQFYDNGTILHLAGKLAPLNKLNRVTGAALQMQRELQWFEEARKLVAAIYREVENHENDTPMTVFRKEHQDLRVKGEDWMKKTADSYTITAALIITIVFASAITVPGGNNGETGIAIYKTRTSFIIFIVSDAISLFTSTTSLLLFLSILTARYAEEDFIYKLPKRLILGLVMLFMSVTTMLIAFGAAIYIMSGQENTRMLIPIAAMTCLPIASFVTLQLPLLVDLLSSTYGRGIFGKLPSMLKIPS